MTDALKEAFAAASQLPDAEQDELAAAIFDELAVDARWDATLAKSAPQLERLAREAVDDYRAGRTTPLDPDDR